MTNQNTINKLKQIYNIRLESYVFLVVSRRECQYLDLFFDFERVQKIESDENEETYTKTYPYEHQ